MIKVTVGGASLVGFSISADPAPSSAYAAEELKKYIKRICGDGESNGKVFSVGADLSMETDEFRLVSHADGITLKGGARGVIYGVYEFLETLGARFYTPKIEVMPNKNVALPADFSLSRKPVIKFREVLDEKARDKAWSVKNRLNSKLWNVRTLGEDVGGGYFFAGIPAHSLTGEYLLRSYTQSNPEYFALVNGKRLTDGKGQICSTSDEAADAAANELIKLLDENPAAGYAALSHGDNHNFCRCERCEKAYEKSSFAEVYLTCLNKIASKVGKKHPNVKLVMLAYEGMSALPDGFELEKNILVQYCSSICRSHAFGDKSCAHNVGCVKEFDKWASVSSGLWIWDYPNCFKYELMPLPYYDLLLENVRFYAEHKAEGIFNECGHTNAEFAGLPELRNYLLCRAMWDPYQSKEEWNSHRDGFLRAMFGDGAKYISDYLDLICTESDGMHMDYNCFPTNGKSSPAVPIIAPDKLGSFLRRGYALLQNALSSAALQGKEEIEKLITQLMYYELYHTMADILKNGTEEQKSEAKRKNKELIERIERQNLKLTFWGKSLEKQNEYLRTCVCVPPSEWDYSW